MGGRKRGSMFRMFVRTTAVAIAALGFAATANAGARVTVDCSISGTVMTVTVDAKTRGGGKPEPIGSAGPVILVLEEKVGTQYSAVSGLKMSMAETGLPASASFDMCNSLGSLINPGSRSVRGRGAAFISGVGFVSNRCSPDKPPTC